MYDALVIGCGGVGSAALYHLARRGLRVLGLDQFPAAHSRGSSHGQTRIFRQAYFEHPSYVPLLLRAYQLWRELEHAASCALLRETGLLQIGPAGGTVVQGVLHSAALHGLRVEQLAARGIAQRFPGFACDSASCGVFEPRAGLLLVEACVQAHLQLARNAGAAFRDDVSVRGWHSDHAVATVQTSAGQFQARRLVVAAGAWTSQLLTDLNLPLNLLKKTQFWFPTGQAAYAADAGCPAFLFETPTGVYYGLPQIDARGVKLAEHCGGASVADPLTVSRALDQEELARVVAFSERHLPDLQPLLADHAVCMYTMTPDEHFVVDVHPHHENVSFAAGLSGHGFKFSGVLGQALADLAIDGQTDLPIDFLRTNRAALQPAVDGRST